MTTKSNTAAAPAPAASNPATDALRLKAINAKLLAALEACAEALRVIADGAGDVPDWNEGGEYYEACEQARAAIAAAQAERGNS